MIRRNPTHPHSLSIHCSLRNRKKTLQTTCCTAESHRGHRVVRLECKLAWAAHIKEGREAGMERTRYGPRSTTQSDAGRQLPQRPAKSFWFVSDRHGRLPSRRMATSDARAFGVRWPHCADGSYFGSTINMYPFTRPPFEPLPPACETLTKPQQMPLEYVTKRSSSISDPSALTRRLLPVSQ